MIQSKKKSEQRLDNQLKKVKKQKDLDDLIED
jgi:hypothetical protein